MLLLVVCALFGLLKLPRVALLVLKPSDMIVTKNFTLKQRGESTNELEL